MAGPEEEYELESPKDKRRAAPAALENDSSERSSQHASYYLGIKAHRGLPRLPEAIICYSLAVLGWLCLIAAAAVAPYEHTRSAPYIATISAAWVLAWAAWMQTAFAMVQRSSWRREETLVERVQFLFFAIRLQRLMIPTAVISFVVFIQAYVRRHEFHGIAYWLLFLLMFILNTVFAVMNAYNNITWEADRLWFEDGVDGIPKAYVAILGI